MFKYRAWFFIIYGDELTISNVTNMQAYKVKKLLVNVNV